jgi:hypothetical protein
MLYDLFGFIYFILHLLILELFDLQLIQLIVLESSINLLLFVVQVSL